MMIDSGFIFFIAWWLNMINCIYLHHDKCIRVAWRICIRDVCFDRVTRIYIMYICHDHQTNCILVHTSAPALLCGLIHVISAWNLYGLTLKILHDCMLVCLRILNMHILTLLIYSWLLLLGWRNPELHYWHVLLNHLCHDFIRDACTCLVLWVLLCIKKKIKAVALFVLSMSMLSCGMLLRSWQL